MESSVFHTILQFWWKWAGERGFCWDEVRLQFKVLSYRDCRSAVTRVKNEYPCCHSIPPAWQTLNLNASKLLFPANENDCCLYVISLAFLPLFLYFCKSLHVRFGTEYWDISIRCFEYWVRSMQDHHLNLCIIFIIIIFIAPSHKEYSIVMAYRGPKT